MSKDDDTQMEEEELEQEQPRAFWSGIIAFGLVSLPVSLYPAHRGKLRRTAGSNLCDLKP